jgi:hypothetical protein
MLLCWSMPTFRRNILSPSSRAEVTRQGNRGQGLMEGSQSEGRNMGPVYGPIGSLQLGSREGLCREWIDRRKWPSSGLTRVREVCFSGHLS